MKVLGCKITDALYDEFKHEAEQLHLTISEYLRLLIDQRTTLTELKDHKQGDDRTNR